MAKTKTRIPTIPSLHPAETPSSLNIPDITGGDIETTTNDILDAVSTLNIDSDSAPEWTPSGPVYINKPLMPTQDGLQRSINEASVTAKQSNSSGFRDALALDPGVANSVDQLTDALRHQETRRSTTDVNTFIGRDALTIPHQVRDIPNDLHHIKSEYGQYFYIRERADKITRSIFGDDLAESVLMAAARAGFKHKPLVWVSQILYVHLNKDYPHDYKKNPSPAFNPTIDEDSSSPLLSGLSSCFDHFTVKNISRLAKYSDVSVLHILRTIFADIVTGLRISIPPVVTGPTRPPIFTPQ